MTVSLLDNPVTMLGTRFDFPLHFNEYLILPFLPSECKVTKGRNSRKIGAQNSYFGWRTDLCLVDRLAIQPCTVLRNIDLNFLEDEKKLHNKSSKINHLVDF